jgi:hypothetical protein
MIRRLSPIPYRIPSSRLVRVPSLDFVTLEAEPKDESTMRFESRGLHLRGYVLSCRVPIPGLARAVIGVSVLDFRKEGDLLAVDLDVGEEVSDWL